MGKPQPHSGAPGSNAANFNASTCPIQHRCHVEGKGIVKFGTSFKQSLVRRLANNAVVVVSTDGKRIGSGTVIDAGQTASQGPITHDGPVNAAIVLCAEHTSQSLGTTPSALIPYHLDKTVAPGRSWEQVNDGAKWIPSDPISTNYVTGQMTKMLEIGRYEVDYAIWLVEFGLQGAPGRPHKGFGRTLSDEVLLVAHPDHTKNDCEPTQASAGPKVADRAKFKPEDSTDYYATARLSGRSGCSGGGVYNTTGELIGVYKGRLASGEDAFLNLGAVADVKPKGTDLLQKFLAGEKYLMST